RQDPAILGHAGSVEPLDRPAARLDPAPQSRRPTQREPPAQTELEPGGPLGIAPGGAWGRPAAPHGPLGGATRATPMRRSRDAPFPKLLIAKRLRRERVVDRRGTKTRRPPRERRREGSQGPPQKGTTYAQHDLTVRGNVHRYGP